MTQLAIKDTSAPCPKCRTEMMLAAVAPHPIATQMERRTYLCQKCNQTKTYMLPATAKPQMATPAA